MSENQGGGNVSLSPEAVVPYDEIAAQDWINEVDAILETLSAKKYHFPFTADVLLDVASINAPMYAEIISEFSDFSEARPNTEDNIQFTAALQMLEAIEDGSQRVENVTRVMWQSIVGSIQKWTPTQISRGQRTTRLRQIGLYTAFFRRPAQQFGGLEKANAAKHRAAVQLLAIMRSIKENSHSVPEFTKLVGLLKQKQRQPASGSGEEVAVATTTVAATTMPQSSPDDDDDDDTMTPTTASTI